MPLCANKTSLNQQKLRLFLCHVKGAGNGAVMTSSFGHVIILVAVFNNVVIGYLQ